VAPSLDVDKARTVMVIKHSMAAGFAGIDNPLYYLDTPASRIYRGTSYQIGGIADHRPGSSQEDAGAKENVTSNFRPMERFYGGGPLPRQARGTGQRRGKPTRGILPIIANLLGNSYPAPLLPHLSYDSETANGKTVGSRRIMEAPRRIGFDVIFPLIVEWMEDGP
jgi:hypothetical protein